MPADAVVLHRLIMCAVLSTLSLLSDHADASAAPSYQFQYQSVVYSPAHGNVRATYTFDTLVWNVVGLSNGRIMVVGGGSGGYHSAGPSPMGESMPIAFKGDEIIDRAGTIHMYLFGGLGTSPPAHATTMWYVEGVPGRLNMYESGVDDMNHHPTTRVVHLVKVAKISIP